MNFYIDSFYESLNRYGEELCGDKVEIVRGGDSLIVVLADGLGSGVKANILATLTSKIIGTMLEKGARVEEAVETIAQTLPICNVRKLAYSTFTILQIFKSGEAYLVEFDNPSVFFIREGNLFQVPFKFRNINGKDVRESRFEVEVGDTIVMVSDGVVHAGVGASLNLGWKWENVAEYLLENIKPNMPAREISHSLVAVCDHLYDQRPGDDATVVAISIRNPLEVSMMAGPPISMEDDRKVVEKFMSDNGKKIVCGGTTAQIVARELGRKIETSMEYYDSSVPPIAYIKGIDLVTEGVLTLTRVVEIIKSYISIDGKERVGNPLDRRDGAACIARILMDDCTHFKLYIGRTINPAHQNPDLPVDLSIKLKLLEELAQLMTILGKKVEKFYF